jgi:sigma-54-specific transcriptional regulator
VLKKYSFSGNVRELKNIVYQACLFVNSKNNQISKQNIIERLSKTVVIEKPASSNLMGGLDTNSHSLTEACEAFESKVIESALLESGGSRSKAAIKLNIPKRTLAYKCKKWSISIENI